MSTTVRSQFVALCLVLGGCALTSKSESTIFRYFTPERSMPPAPPTPANESAGPDLDLRLGRVNAASYLKDRIAFRDADNEVGYYEDARWTEKPESYLRRAVGRALFEGQKVRQSINNSGRTLELELNSFDEVRTPRHVARVEITWMLRDDRAVQIQRTFSVERPIGDARADARPGAVASAMSEALGDAVKTIVSSVVSELSRTPAAPAAP